MQGFSLLEAIVALVVFSLGAASLFAWQSSSLRAMQTLERRTQRAEAIRLGLATIASVNPLLEPSGERRHADRIVRWQATPVAPAKPGRSTRDTPGIFELGLFTLNVGVSARQREAPLAEFEVRQVGHRQVRRIDDLQ